MNSRMHGSEKALAELACAKIAPAVEAPRLLIGGLGMGFTLAAALQTVGPDAEVVVAELVPEVVEWNRTRDRRTGRPSARGPAQQRARRRRGRSAFAKRRRRLRRHSDGRVDNGPEALRPRKRERLAVHAPTGLRAARAALAAAAACSPCWSASPDRAFSKRLQHAGFDVDEHVVRPHRAGKGPRHVIWIAAASRSAREVP